MRSSQPVVPGNMTVSTHVPKNGTITFSTENSQKGKKSTDAILPHETVNLLQEVLIIQMTIYYMNVVNWTKIELLKIR